LIVGKEQRKKRKEQIFY